MRKFFWTDNEHLQAEVESYFNMLEEYNQSEFNGEISILLLGSMSRGEGSWKTIDGVDTIVSDIEFTTLVPVGFSQHERLNEVFELAKNRCFPDQKSSLFHIDNGIGGGGYDMSGMERKLITFDANVFSTTVVGKDYKNTMPQVTYSNINMQDIWEVLIHRIFSVLYWGRPLKDAGKIDEYRYNIAKNSLDLMTVLLVNHQQLVSGFANRLVAIKKLDVDENVKRYFEYCLSIKLSLPCEHSYSIEEMENIFVNILEQQNKEFGLHISNYLTNLKFIARRNMGKAKRALRLKHIPPTQKRHLSNMVKQFKRGDMITDKIIKDNIVLNGYPQ